MSFMAQPAQVFKSYLEATAFEDRWYQYGMLAMSLEIITRIKVLEELPVTTEVGRQEAITVLHTMLTEIGISELAHEWYDRLDEWRKPKFSEERPVRSPDLSVYELLEQQLVHAEPSDAPDGQLRPGQASASELASEHEARPLAPSLLGSPPEPVGERRSPREVTTVELGEWPSVASETKPSG